MEHGILPPPDRRFGNDVVDIVPARGLRSGGPYSIPEYIIEHGVYIVPVIINSPGFNLTYDHALWHVREICKAIKEYFKVRCNIIELDQNSVLSIADHSISSIRDLYRKLEGLRQEIIRRGYRDKLNGTAVMLFTRSTSPKIKVTPYYVTKAIFSYEPVSQVITERVLNNPDKSFSYSNIALGIFTKLGGIPWRLDELIPSADLIVGIGRTVIKHGLHDQGETVKSWIGSVAILRADGVLREVRATVMKTRDELANWIEENIGAIIRSFIARHPLEEISVSIHYSGKRPWRGEIDRVEKTIEELRRRENIKIGVKIIHVTDDIPHRFLGEKFNLYPIRGFYWITSEREAYLTPLGASLIGSKTYYSFTGIPSTLKVELVRTIGSPRSRDTLIDSLSEIYSLTYMHIAGLNIGINEPISTKYSRRLAYMVSSLEITNMAIIAQPYFSTSYPTAYERLWFL